MKRKYINDYELIYLVVQGDDVALEELIEKYKGLMYKTLNAYRDILKDKFDVKELYQITLISLYHAILTYNDNMECSFTTYLKIILDRDILAYIRVLNRDRNRANLYSVSLDQVVKEGDNTYLVDMVENNQRDYDPKDLLNRKELETLIDEQLTSFTKQEQQVFRLWCSGYRYDEIASICDYEERKISYLLSKIKKKLKGSIDSAYTL